MSRRTTLPRRTVLKRLAVAGTVLSTIPAASAASESGSTTEDDPGPPDCRRLRRQVTRARAKGRTTDPDTYVAVVDRIVDGAHVVLLLEDGDELVDQIVEPREDLPDVEEGETLLVAVEDGELIEWTSLTEENATRGPPCHL